MAASRRSTSSSSMPHSELCKNTLSAPGRQRRRLPATRLRRYASDATLFCQQQRQPIQQRTLSLDHLLPRRVEPEPDDAVDLGKGGPASAFRRPFCLEAVASECRDVEIAFCG